VLHEDSQFIDFRVIATIILQIQLLWRTPAQKSWTEQRVACPPQTMTEKQFRKNQIYMHVYQKAVLMNGTIPKSPCLLDPRYCCVMSWTLFPSCLELKMQFTQPRRRTCQTFSEQEKCVLTNFHDYLCKPAYCGRVQAFSFSRRPSATNILPMNESMIPPFCKYQWAWLSILCICLGKVPKLNSTVDQALHFLTEK